MDNIRVGLDFGTHQTKICIQRTPDEGHGEPMYEFFTFKDQEGRDHYFLPSIVQVNVDDTLSYGFVNPDLEKGYMEKPKMEISDINNEKLTTEEHAQQLFEKYATDINSQDDIEFIKRMLSLRQKKLNIINASKYKTTSEEYESKITDYLYNSNVYRYFKQATFAEREWKRKLDCEFLSILYLANVIFLLEEKFGANFSINMGIPADENEYEKKKIQAVEILLTAYNLVEDVYGNDMKAFLSDTITDIKSKVKYIFYSESKKFEYNINIFPEAYASLISLTSRGKITSGMSLTADIGGGTTDISFFTLKDGQPNIFRYWSIPRGLNYIAEKSGFDYYEGDFEIQANKDVIKKYNDEKQKIVAELVCDLVRQIIKETSIPVQNLTAALKNRVLVYTGGGSTIPFMTSSMGEFSDVKFIKASMWNEEHISDKAKVSTMCSILTTAYGLSLSENDNNVKLSRFTTLFDNLPRKEDKKYSIVDKDMC